jgi:hypothetical protein
VKKGSNENTRTDSEAKDRPFRVTLPGFLVEDEIGLGDALKRVTYAFGMDPCGNCERRAATLNQWVRFSRSP